jgi:Cu-Zn family superoxide dismutase
MNQTAKAWTTAAVLAVGLAAATAFAQEQTATPAPEMTQPDAAVSLSGVDGQAYGIFTFTVYDYRIIVSGQVTGMPPGFHGLHIHTSGRCEDDGGGPFSAAGDHLNLMGLNHPDHAGDLPPLLVLQDGTAYLSVSTDRFTMDDLLDEDGSSLIVHERPDNFGNIPDRYFSFDEAGNRASEGGPDEETLATGDSGARIACGVIVEVPPMDMTGDMATPEMTMPADGSDNMMPTQPAEATAEVTPDGESTVEVTLDVTVEVTPETTPAT